MPRIVLAVLAAASALVACGGDDSGGSASSSTTTADRAPQTSAPGTTSADVAGPSVPPRRDASDPLCMAAADLRQADADYQVRVELAVQDALAQQDTAPLNEALASIEEDGTLAELLDAYDRLSPELPADQQANAAKLQAFTEEFFRGVNGLPSFAEIESYLSALEEDPEAQAANDAGAALDAYVRQECGAGITASG